MPSTVRFFVVVVMSLLVRTDARRSLAKDP
jgi:hypothetical protein